MVKVVHRQGHVLRWYRNGRKQMCPFTISECGRECADWCPFIRFISDKGRDENIIELSCVNHFAIYKADFVDTKGQSE